MVGKKRFIIDTDAGIDDAQAILMALNSPDVEIVAITTCHGNTDVDQVCKNVLRLLKVADRLDIPVYIGCSKPMLGKTVTAANYHGLDGFGDVPDPEAPDISLAQSEHAVSALVRLVDGNRDELTLVALAPCTNIAVALRLDPEMGKKLKNCYMMGGNYEGKGNITQSAEFNFYADPEAAHVVLQELRCPLYLVCWELCLKQSLPWEVYEELRSTITTKNLFLVNIEKQMMDNCHKLGWPTYIPCDELPMLAALKGNDVIMDSVTCHTAVEIRGTFTRAQMTLDWNDQLGKQKNVIIIREVNSEMYLNALRMAIL